MTSATYPREIGLDYPASGDAMPPIHPEEARGAATAICRYHKGRIIHGLATGERYGQVFYCPIGRQYWRLTERVSAMHRPLAWPKGM